MASPITPKLADDAKLYAVQALACFDPPSVVRDALKAEFGASITAQAVESYDPTKRAGRALSGRLRAIFEETRKTFLEDTGRIGISHRSVRLRALHRMAERAESMGNLALAAQLHKQAAEEVGDAYTNRRELTGKNGAPLPAPTTAVAVFALPDNGRG